MSYLFPNATTTELGVVQVGANIDVDTNSIISIPQSVATTATVTFAGLIATTATITTLFVATEFDTGNLTVGGVVTVNTTTNSSSTSTGAVIIKGGVGIGGNLYAGAVYDNGNRSVTSVTPTAGTGIGVTSVTTSGPAAAFTINNTGVTSIVAGTNISINTSTGAVTVTASSSPIIQTTGTAVAYLATATDDYIGVTANPTIVTLPTGTTGKSYIIKNETTGNTTVTGTLGQLLDASLTKTLGANASITVVFRAGAWRLV